MMASISPLSTGGRPASGAPAKTDAGSGPISTAPVPRPIDPAVVLALSAQAAQVPMDLAKALADQKADSQSALSALDQARKTMISDRKEAAKQKLEQLRMELKMLRMLGGDPKSVAMQAKALAKELKAAASEYGYALKSASELDVGAAAISTAAADQLDAPAETTDTTAGMGAALVEEKHSAAPADDPEGVREKALQAYQDRAAASEVKAQEDREIRETYALFKETGREIKQLIENAVQKMKAKNASDADAQDAQRAKAAMGDELQGLGKLVSELTGGSEAGIVDQTEIHATVPVPSTTALDILT